MTTKTATDRDEQNITQTIGATSGKCPIGETIGRRGMDQSKIPVLSCEGACIRGEIARLAASMIAKEEPYGRGGLQDGAIR